MKKISQIFTKIPRTVRRGIIAATALLTLAAHGQPVPVFTNVWQLSPTFFADMPTNGNNMRGIAISPITTNVLYGTTASATNQGVNVTGNHVSVLDFATGTNQLAQLKTVPNGSQVNLGKIGVADDGKVYAINLTTAPVGVNQYFKIYQWPSETDITSEALYVFDSTNIFNPTGLPYGTTTNSFGWRVGDYMDVRGSGINTEIVVMGNGTTSTNILIFRPTDAALTNFTYLVISTPFSGANVGGAGVAFEGTNNAIWCRQSGLQTTRRIAYNTNTLTSVATVTNTVDQSACQGLKYFSANGINMLATVQATATTNGVQRARVFTIPAASGPLVSVLNSAFPSAPANVNGNAIGQVDYKKGYVAFGAPGNGITLWQLSFVTNSPPAVTLSVSGNPIVEGFNTTYTATASGSSPFTYIWNFDNGVSTNVIGSNTNILAFTPANLANGGNYFVIVTNLFGSVTSSVSTLTVLPAKFTGYATNLWTLAPGSRPYLTTGDTQRGLAYDSVSNRVVVVSRSPSNSVYLLNADTGADAGTLDVSLLLSPNPTPPGAFPISMTGVGDDGAIYVGNLITSAGSDTFSIYRWASADPTIPATQAYLNNPAVARLGDTMAVHGAGPDTQILCSFRTGTNLALFLPNDGLGLSYDFHLITVTNLPADAVANGFAGLGLAFGNGNTFWAKSSSFSLRLVSFDTNDFNAQVIATYTNLPAGEGPLGADNLNGYVATIGINQTPQNLSLWDVARGEPFAGQLDREVFGSNNANANGTGAVAFDPAHRRIFALDSNNGLIALSYSLYYLNIGPVAGGGVVTWPGTGDLQSATVVTGPYTDIIGATSPYTNAVPGRVFFRVRR